MADDLQLNLGSGGEKLRTEQLTSNSTHVQHVKLVDVSGGVEAAHGLATQTTLASLLTELQLKPDQTEQFATRSDTFTETGNGQTIDCSSKPMGSWSLAVKGTGAVATSWGVVLEGSLDNVNFTTMLNHVTATLDGIVLFSGSNRYPALYVRSRCTALVLGSATNVVVTFLGTP